MNRRNAVLFMLVLPIAALFVGCKSTLTAVSGKYYYYEITDDRVTFFSWNPMSQQYHTAVLVEADPKTFTQVTSQYGKDASQVFHKSLPIAGADPSTFVLLKKGYAVDATQVFYNRKRLAGADPRTFERLDYGWSQDADNIYLGSRRLDICDIETFEIIPTSRAKDAQCYYAEAKRVPIKDRETLEVLSGGYAKDVMQVYWLDRIVEGADAASFEVRRDTPSSIARDAYRCFGGPTVLTCDELIPEGQAFCRC
jgi:hypothetical protein